LNENPIHSSTQHKQKLLASINILVARHAQVVVTNLLISPLAQQLRNTTALYFIQRQWLQKAALLQIWQKVNSLGQIPSKNNPTSRKCLLMVFKDLYVSLLPKIQ
jgi:hypothetical protein